MYVSPLRVSLALRAAHPILRTHSADTTIGQIDDTFFIIVGVDLSEGAKLE